MSIIFCQSSLFDDIHILENTIYMFCQIIFFSPTFLISVCYPLITFWTLENWVPSLTSWLLLLLLFFFKKKLKWLSALLCNLANLPHVSLPSQLTNCWLRVKALLSYIAAATLATLLTNGCPLGPQKSLNL